jgi:hypothetical protein
MVNVTGLGSTLENSSTCTDRPLFAIHLSPVNICPSGQRVRPAAAAEAGGRFENCGTSQKSTEVFTPHDRILNQLGITYSVTHQVYKPVKSCRILNFGKFRPFQEGDLILGKTAGDYGTMILRKQKVA